MAVLQVHELPLTACAMTCTRLVLWAAHAHNSHNIEISVYIMVSLFMFLCYTVTLHASAVNSTAIKEQKTTVSVQNTQSAMYFQVL